MLLEALECYHSIPIYCEWINNYEKHQKFEGYPLYEANYHFTLVPEIEFLCKNCDFSKSKWTKKGLLCFLFSKEDNNHPQKDHKHCLEQDWTVISLSDKSNGYNFNKSKLPYHCTKYKNNWIQNSTNKIKQVKMIQNTEIISSETCKQAKSSEI